jgi:hypothetical protein
MIARDIYAQEIRRELGRRATVQYPENLKRLPQFVDWLRNVVSIAIGRGEELFPDVIEASKLPEISATAYRHMYAHGMHF